MSAAKTKGIFNRMERNENGYPIAGARDHGTHNHNCAPEAKAPMGGCAMQIDSMPLAYAYVPIQRFRMLYDPENALARGTLFEELDLPKGVYNNGK